MGVEIQNQNNNFQDSNISGNAQNYQGASIQNQHNYFTYIHKKVFIFLFLVLSSAGVLHFIHNIWYDSLFSSAVWFDIAVFIFVGTISIMLFVGIILFILMYIGKIFNKFK